MKTLFIICLTIGSNLLVPVKNLACPIPVFRYALEFWDADPYRLEILYKNSLSSGEEKIVNDFQNISTGNVMKSNLIMRTVDIDNINHDIPQSVLKNLSPEEFPLMILRYPAQSRTNTILWKAPLNIKNVDVLLTSPSRESIANKLISDATAVWLFLESGDRRKDRDALELLNRELRRLEQTLTLPDFTLWLDNNQDTSSVEEPRIKFDVLTVSRNDPNETLLLKMLLSSEQYLTEFESEPIVFPIYGRGIVLMAIVGKGINEDAIAAAARFLIGPCSCQIKMLNPGVDLLISKDWDKLVKNITDVSIANPLSGMGDFNERETIAKRRLESAIMERLAKTGSKDQNQDTDLKKLVYLDILGDSKQKNQVEVPVKAIEKNTNQKETEPEPVYNVPSHPEYAVDGNELSADKTDPTSRKMSFNTRIALVFALIISLVVMVGVFLYWKNIK